MGGGGCYVILFIREGCRDVFQLTALVYIRGDVDGGGVVGDEALEVGVDVEIIWDVAVLLLRLIQLRRRNRTCSFGAETNMEGCFVFGSVSVCVSSLRLLTHRTRSSPVTATDKVSVWSIR